ncbi:hypothetical protein PoB_002069700 [Plakobranchus ocellatus]|uniref:Uncharacterized protein n=1 Tax=Plakobranchus ocellatus TaxID=259542 RepID=A0AAV3ZI26_9GAST|nr:hypothetical protein PoB_002069700 [Plakobranchus ocellatus]
MLVPMWDLQMFSRLVLNIEDGWMCSRSPYKTMQRPETLGQVQIREDEVLEKYLNSSPGPVSIFGRASMLRPQHYHQDRRNTTHDMSVSKASFITTKPLGDPGRKEDHTDHVTLNTTLAAPAVPIAQAVLSRALTIITRCR